MTPTPSTPFLAEDIKQWRGEDVIEAVVSGSL